MGTKEAVRGQSVLQSIKSLRHSKLPDVGNDNSGVPHAGAVPDITDRYEADLVLAANWQNGGNVLVRRAGCIGADARHRGGHLDSTAFLRAAHAAVWDVTLS